VRTDDFKYDPTKGLMGMPTATMGEFPDDDAAREYLRAQAEELAKLHDYLMAHSIYGLFLVFQGMDAAGKDEAIRSVMSVVDPQGCEVKMYKKPGEKELRHDYLWRVTTSAPARGQIGIFNRSHYEHVVAERVHPDRLDDQHLPPEARDDIYTKRFGHINDYESYLADNGIHVIKLYFHISKEEQRRRLIERIDRPDKRWHFASDDLEERECWEEYMKAYDAAFRHTHTAHAPWYIVPADHRWFGRALAATIITEKLAALHSGYPELGDKQDELAAARRQLEAQGDTSEDGPG
jgi:PPK2 family polyphosphate:nucleotide phosphotransferase